MCNNTFNIHWRLAAQKRFSTPGPRDIIWDVPLTCSYVYSLAAPIHDPDVVTLNVEERIVAGLQEMRQALKEIQQNVKIMKQGMRDAIRFIDRGRQELRMLSQSHNIAIRQSNQSQELTDFHTSFYYENRTKTTCCLGKCPWINPRTKT